jgi:PAS domain S-box-containing protein
VLVVEDDEDDAILLARALSRGGYAIEYERVDTAEAMTAALAAREWDAILSDFSMPTFSAPAALALLHSSGLDLPFIIVSGTIGEDVAVAAMKAGAHDYLTKRNLARLVAAVERELREAAERKARHAAEAQLRASEAHLRAILDSALDAIMTFDPAGRIVSANAAAERVFGWSAEELVGRSFHDLVVPSSDDADGDATPRSRGGALRHPGARELVGRRRSGQAFPMDVAVSVMQGGDRRLGIAIVRDVTERKELEAQVRQMLRTETIGRLAGGIAHDFNNLLAVILSYANVAVRDVPQGTRLRADLEEILQAGQRAAGLTRQLLAFSRRQVITPRVLSVNELIAEMNRMLRRIIGANVTLDVVAAADLGAVRADRGQLEQVLMNLVVNARDAMPEGGTVTISTANVVVDEPRARHHGVAPGGYVELTVADTGVGIAPEVLPHLFEPFFTSKEPGKGTGLGLATTQGIVKQAGGFIVVEGAPGRGARFSVLLPRVAEQAEPAVAEEVAAPVGRETVLVVEDEPSLREVAVRGLRDLGYAVLEAKDGFDALRVVDKTPGPIDLLLTDVVMPGLGGRKLAERMRVLRPEARVLYTSGYTDGAFLAQSAGEPARGFLQKPFTLAALARKVRETLDEPAPRDTSAPPSSSLPVAS